MNWQCCPVCRYPFVSQFRSAYVICSSQHLLCPCCIHRLKISNQRKCPECRKDFRKPTRLWKPFGSCDNALSLIQTKSTQDMISTQELLAQQIFQLVSNTLSQQLQIATLCKETVIKFMKTQSYHGAANILRKIIETYPKWEQQGNFIGLGIIYEFEGFYQNKPYNWFQSRFGPNISFYDLLAICYLKSQFSYQSRKSWFQAIHNKRPESIQALFGLAVTELNQGKFKQSQILINRVIEINHEFPKAHLAKQIISFMVDNPNIIKRSSFIFNNYKYNFCLPESLNTKIYKCDKEYFQVEKVFARPTFVKGGAGNICNMLLMKQWSKVNDEFVEAHLHLGVSFYFVCQYGEALNTITNILKNKHPSPFQKSRCYQYLGKIYFILRKFRSALKFLKLAQPNCGFNRSDIMAFKIQALHNKNSSKTVESAQAALQTMKQWMQQTLSVVVKQDIVKNMEPIYCLLAIRYFRTKLYSKLKCLLKQWIILLPTKKSIYYLQIQRTLDKHFASKENQTDLLQWQILNLDLPNHQENIARPLQGQI